MLFSILTCAAIIIGDIYIAKYSDKYIFPELSLVSYNNAGLLLGTSRTIGSGKVNQYFENRIKAAVELYRAGKIRHIIVSGDNSTKGYNEPSDMKKALMTAGIPENVIHPDYAGFRTFDSIIRAREIFGQNRITIISQQFHNERAVYIARKHGMNAVAFNALDVEAYGGFLTRLREKAARIRTIFILIFGSEPKFMGPKINIDC